MRKGEIAWYKQFLLFSQCFPQLYIFNSVKMHHCVVIGLTILQNVPTLVLQVFFINPNLEAFESYTTSNRLNHMDKPIRRCVTFKFSKTWRNDKVCS